MIRTLMDRISAGIPAWMQEAKVPGAAVALLERGQPAAIACFGLQDAGTDTPAPITAATVFEAASLGKPLFAYAVMKLFEQGALNPDAPLSDILPEPLIPGEPRLQRITARRVLSHSSGLPNWRRDEPLALLFDPGARFGYSGEGYVYLQRAVESLTGRPMEDYLRQRLILPLGMAQTRYAWQPAFDAGFATGHDPQGKPLPKNKPVEANSATSLHTTIDDYARFLTLMLAPANPPGVGLAEEWMARMLTPQTSIDADSAWGLGWGLKRIGDDWLFWQWGDNRGFKHLIAGSRQQGVAVCVLTNGENGYRVWSRVLQHTLDSGNTFLHLLERL